MFKEREKGCLETRVQDWIISNAASPVRLASLLLFVPLSVTLQTEHHCSVAVALHIMRVVIQRERCDKNNFLYRSSFECCDAEGLGCNTALFISHSFILQQGC